MNRKSKVIATLGNSTESILELIVAGAADVSFDVLPQAAKVKVATVTSKILSDFFMFLVSFLMFINSESELADLLSK